MYWMQYDMNILTPFLMKSVEKWRSVAGGVLTYLAKRGCAALMGRFHFTNMGPVFYQKILNNMGQLFWLESKFSLCENP